MLLIILLGGTPGKKANNVDNPRIEIMTRFSGGFPLIIMLGLLFISQF
jgi:hypothetical protein